MKNKSKKKSINIRLIVQTFFLLLVASIMINRELAEVGKAIPFLSEASLHSICPFGGVVSLYQFLTSGSYTHQIHDSSFILMFLVIALTLIFGAVFCGWICPLGTVQEWVGKLGKKLWGKKYNHFIPENIDMRLRYLRYIVLVLVLYVTANTGMLAFKSVDPYHALFQFWTGEVALTAFIILGITLLGSLLIERPWCKYLCPFGAVLGTLSKISLFTLRRNMDTCINCNACNRACPMNIDVTRSSSVRDTNCIVCLQCSSESACPLPETMSLSYDLPKKRNTGITKERSISDEN